MSHEPVSLSSSPLEQGTINSIEVFCSYAHVDEVVVQTVLAALEPLVQQGLLIIWSDRSIFAGREWVNEIDLHLNTSQIILLFASPAFLASRYCQQVEVPRALERAQRKEAVLIPILLAPIELSSTLFGRLQALPPGGKALSEWADQTEVKATIASHLEALARRLLPRTETPPPRAQLLNMPFRRNPYFTGREEVLELLYRSLAQYRASALVQAMTGLGGIGKTQTAIEYVYRYQNEYDTVLWVNAETRESLIEGYGQLAHLLELPQRHEKEQELVIQAVIRWMQTNKNWLLVLDNVDDSEVVNSFLPQTEWGQVLMTTRSQMVGGRAIQIPINALDPETGALLLLRRARLLSPSSTLYTPSLSPELREDAIALSKELGGLPLALDQAGAYIETTGCGIAGYQERYGFNKIHYLTERGASEIEYPLSVALTWSLSFRRVKQSNQVAVNLLQMCAFLAPDAIPERMLLQIAATLSPSLHLLEIDPFLLDDALRVLRMYSLIYRETNREAENFLSMHRLVQVLVRDAMSEEQQRALAERVVGMVADTCPNVQDVEQWGACDQWLPHALVCTEWIGKYALQQEGAWHLLNQAVLYLRARARYEEATRLQQRALELDEAFHGPEHLKVATDLNNLAELYRAQGRYREAESLLERALVIDKKMYGPEHPRVATDLNTLASVYQDQGRLVEADLLYTRSLGIREKQLGSMHSDVAGSLNNLAELYRDQGRYRDAESLYQQSLVIWEKQLGENHPNIVMVLNNLANIYHDQGRLGEAEPLYQRILTIVERQLGPEHPKVASTLNNLAELYRDQGRYGEAKPLYQRSLFIKEKQLGRTHPAVATALNNLALLYFEQGRYGEAEPLHERALTIREQQLDSMHPDIAQSLNNLALLYVAQGRREEAEPLYQRALAIWEKQLDSEHPQVASGLNNLALLYSEQGRLLEAELLYQRSLKIAEEQLGPEHLQTAGSLNNLAVLYQNQSKYSEAEPLYVRALAIREQQLGEMHPDTASSLNNLAEIYRKQGRYREAVPLYHRVLTIVEKQLGPEHRYTTIILTRLAELYRAQGRYREAVPLLKRAIAIWEKQLGENHPDVASALNNLASLYYDQEWFPEAELLYLRAVGILEHTLGNKHPNTRAVRKNYAAHLRALGKEEEALALEAKNGEGYR